MLCLGSILPITYDVSLRRLLLRSVPRFFVNHVTWQPPSRLRASMIWANHHDGANISNSPLFLLSILTSCCISYHHSKMTTGRLPINARKRRDRQRRAASELVKIKCHQGTIDVLLSYSGETKAARRNQWENGAVPLTSVSIFARENTLNQNGDNYKDYVDFGRSSIQ